MNMKTHTHLFSFLWTNVDGVDAIFLESCLIEISTVPEFLLLVSLFRAVGHHCERQMELVH